MLLLFDDTKKLENALGAEAASVIVRVFEKADEHYKQELATKVDLENGLTAVRHEITAVKTELSAEIAKSKIEMIKWVTGLLMAQAAVIAALVKML